MKVAVIGANGQLGSDLLREFSVRGHEVVSLTHEDIQVEDVDSVARTLRSIKPDVVLNTAAYHNVPRCEENALKSFDVNSLGALHLARISDDLGAAVVYYSTDYVFDGSKRAPYLETDSPNPLNIYASTKLVGEYYTLNHARKGYVMRVSGLYGKNPCRAKGGNFVTTMIKLARERPEVKVVCDEILTPTPTSEIASRTLDIVQSEALGLFHLTSEGECSWYEFAQVIFATLNLSTPLFSCSAQDFPSTLRRPSYAVLENARLKELGLRDMPHWRDALISFLESHRGSLL
jgi:dTDP-4-dehydrorhamnose reductase